MSKHQYQKGTNHITFDFFWAIVKDLCKIGEEHNDYEEEKDGIFFFFLFLLLNRYFFLKIIDLLKEKINLETNNFIKNYFFIICYIILIFLM